ncbi:MAG: DNA cytosine methyltransferase, partial [Spirochaetaceae bacterium]|nr:DNA cytosine methyltransferase [Spirochaetaceae bacterium]
MGAKKTEPKILSLFSGCGGLDWGFHLAGYKTVWANDINEWAVQTFT